MATNPPKGDGHRNGAVKNRSQVENPKNDRYVKTNKDDDSQHNGEFMDQKSKKDSPFKGVTKENKDKD